MEETSEWHAFIPVSHRLVFFPPDKTLWRNIGGVLVVAVVPDSVAVVVCRSSASGCVGT